MGNTSSNPSKKISRTKSKEPTPLRQEAHEESTVDGPVHAGRLALPEVQAQAREREREREAKGKGKEIPESQSQPSVANGDVAQPSGPAPGEAVPMGANEVSPSIRTTSREGGRERSWRASEPSPSTQQHTTQSQGKPCASSSVGSHHGAARARSRGGRAGGGGDGATEGEGAS